MAERAEAFARKAHHGQFRKWTGQAFIEHPRRVAEAVSNYPGATREMVAAAWLHDTIEDCDTTVVDLANEFGHVVALYVGYLTNYFTNDRFPDLNRAQRKEKEVERLRGAPRAAKVIKLIDRIDNVTDMAGATPEFREIYAAESQKLALAIGDADSRLQENLMTYSRILLESK